MSTLHIHLCYLIVVLSLTYFLGGGQIQLDNHIAVLLLIVERTVVNDVRVTLEESKVVQRLIENYLIDSYLKTFGYLVLVPGHTVHAVLYACRELKQIVRIILIRHEGLLSIRFSGRCIA